MQAENIYKVMKTNEDWRKLTKARDLSKKMYNLARAIVDSKKFPVYYDNLVRRHLAVDLLIIDLKYK